MSEPFKIYVLPVSGSFFPVQLGILAALSSAFEIIQSQDPTQTSRVKRPDVVLAASGGNIAAYLATASDWDRSRLYSNVDHVVSDLFLKPWYDNVPTWMFLPFSRSIFRPGFGFTTMYKKIFPEGFLESKQAPEIWTGTFHRRTGQQRMFVNRKLGETLLKPVNGTDPKSIKLGNTAPVYAGGDLDILAKASLASASIPWLVRPVEILGELYTDGGGAFASPVSVVADQVFDLSEGGRKLHLTYVSSLTLAEPRESKDTFVGEIRNLLHSNYVCDLRIFISIIVRLGAPEEPEAHFDMSPSNLSDLLTSLKNNSYAIALFPNVSGLARCVNLANIIPDQTRDVMSLVESSTAAFVWKVV